MSTITGSKLMNIKAEGFKILGALESAKARYEEAKATLSAEKAKLPYTAVYEASFGKSDTDAEAMMESPEFAAWCDEVDAIERRVGEADAYRAVYAAEEALMDWMDAATKRLYSPKMYSEIAVCFTEKTRRNLTHRQKLIGLCRDFVNKI